MSDTTTERATHRGLFQVGEVAPGPAVATRAAPKAVVGDGVSTAAVDLSWIPLGAGAQSVRINGIVYEAVLAAVQGRDRRDLYHSVLGIRLPHGHYMVEMTPVPGRREAARGVVAVGAVGLRAAGRFRLFRYEVRRWRDGIVPDLGYATGPPIRVTDDPGLAQAVFDLLPLVPTAVWGRDEMRTGDMWSCNSVIAWVLTMAGADVDAVALPRHGRAPGWDAGITVARRSMTSRGCDSDHIDELWPVVFPWG